MFVITKADLVCLALKGESADLTNQLAFEDIDACEDEFFVLVDSRVGIMNMGRGGYIVVMQLMLAGESRELDVSVAEYRKLVTDKISLKAVGEEAVVEPRMPRKLALAS